MTKLAASCFCLVLSFGVVAGCSVESDVAAGSQTSNAAAVRLPPPLPPPPDVGDIGEFHSCQAKPRRALSAREQCQIEKLAARCTPADDGLVSCITSPEGYKAGGGCSHVCFFGPHQGEPKPPGWAECDALAEPENTTHRRS